MIHAICSASDIEVSGDAPGLKQLAQFLRGHVSDLVLELDRAQPQSLERIALRECAERLSIKAEGSALVISGAKELFPLLAQNIEFLIKDSSGSASNHLHIEFVPDHFYLSEHSTPVVVTKVASRL